jgi:hypothetical protein
VLTASETVAAFTQPITDPDLATLRNLQVFLLKVSVVNPNESLAATRLLALLTSTDLYALLLDVTYPITLTGLSEAQFSEIVPLQELLDLFAPFNDAVRVAFKESKKYLPKFTTDFINDYNTSDAPLEQLTTTTFMILSANLQDL